MLLFVCGGFIAHGWVDMKLPGLSRKIGEGGRGGAHSTVGGGIWLGVWLGRYSALPESWGRSIGTLVSTHRVLSFLQVILTVDRLVWKSILATLCLFYIQFLVQLLHWDPHQKNLKNVLNMGGGGEVWIVKVLNFVQVVLVSGDDQLQMVLWEELLISRATTVVVDMPPRHLPPPFLWHLPPLFLWHLPPPTRGGW